MIADHSLSCKGATYVFMQIYSIAAGVVWNSMVVFFAWVLFSNKSDLSDPLKAQHQRHNWFRFLFEPYKPDCYYCTLGPDV